MKSTLGNVWRFSRQEILKIIAGITGQEFFLQSERCLIIAPHPDDEVLGCGGLLAERSANGKETDLLFLTKGGASHKDCCTINESQISTQRQRLAISANQILGVSQSRINFLGGRDGNLPRKDQQGFANFAEEIAVCINKAAPETIFCPSPFEGWSDHLASEELTKAALKMLAHGLRPRFYYYCVWFWYAMPLKQVWRIDWQRARLLDIAEQLPLKQKSMSVYIDALATCGNPWIGKLPSQFIRAFNWNKELFFAADKKS